MNYWVCSVLLTWFWSALGRALGNEYAGYQIATSNGRFFLETSFLPKSGWALLACIWKWVFQLIKQKSFILVFKNQRQNADRKLNNGNKNNYDNNNDINNSENSQSLYGVGQALD